MKKPVKTDKGASDRKIRWLNAGCVDYCVAEADSEKDAGARYDQRQTFLIRLGGRTPSI